MGEADLGLGGLEASVLLAQPARRVLHEAAPPRREARMPLLPGLGQTVDAVETDELWR